MVMKIFLGADHAGFRLKESLKVFLEKKYKVEDLGAFSFKRLAISWLKPFTTYGLSG